MVNLVFHKYLQAINMCSWMNIWTRNLDCFVSRVFLDRGYSGLGLFSYFILNHFDGTLLSIYLNCFYISYILLQNWAIFCFSFSWSLFLCLIGPYSESSRYFTIIGMWSARLALRTIRLLYALGWWCPTCNML